MILEKINSPEDLRLLRREFLPQLAEEIRKLIIETVAKTGGHLAPSLGCVELAIALHYVYDTPKDKIIWDVGHQSYAHKILTGRKDKFATLRQWGGISGFTRREESEYDFFGTGHSSTAVSAALGIATARDLSKGKYSVVAVIGDGTITGGMAYEALNNAGHLRTNLLVILNDNEMFISHRVGAIAGYLTRILTLGLLKKAERKIEYFFHRLHFAGLFTLRIAKRFKVLFFPGMLFEELGFSYLGPIDGHDLNLLIDTLERIKNFKDFKGPLLLHIITKKGKGFPLAEKEPTKFHGIEPFDITTGNILKISNCPTYSSVFGQTLVHLAKEDKHICAITAAMSVGTGLTEFAKEFPERFFDVGIAEQHAVTFAAGLAAVGMHPVCVIYSTFLQRAFDQIIHDVALQKLPVIFAIDRAGIVGEDGPTHQGIFDLTYLRMIPNLTVMAPADENELRHMLYTALDLEKPVAIRYPRGEGKGINFDPDFKKLPYGKGEILISGKDLLIVAIGSMVYPALEAIKQLEKENIYSTLINLRFLKPLDEVLIREKLKESVHPRIVTIEENVVSGLGGAVKEIFSKEKVEILSIGLPDQFVEQGEIELLKEEYGLSPEKIVKKIKDFLAG
jgi:1-deoxy-D-xylulose-5-phosphate synthase